MAIDPDNELVVWKNPSFAEFKEILQKYGELRGMATIDGPLYVWNAYTWTHGGVGKYLGHLNYVYFYFSLTKDVQADEWKSLMRKAGKIFMGVKYEERKYNDARNIGLSHPMISRAVGLNQPE